MNNEKYLEHLLEGIGSNDKKLKPITALAWKKEEDSSKADNTHLPSGKLKVDLDIFKAGGALKDGDWAKEYAFIQEQKQTQVTQAKASAFYLAQAWGSRCAAAEDEYIALFDKNRLTAAKAVCEQKGAGNYLYVKGAIAGIQGYIYNNIKSEQADEGKKASRRLRGRSFFVALLGDLIAEHIIEKLGLELANILFVGGGHFNLLVPASEEKNLETIIWTLNKGLLSDFGLKLGLVFSAVSVNEADFADFGAVMGKVSMGLENAKNRRFDGHLEELFFKSGLKQSKVTADSIRVEEKMMEKAGRWIPKADFIVEVAGKKSVDKKTIGCIYVRFLDKTFFFVRAEDLLYLTGELAKKELKIHRLNSFDFLPIEGNELLQKVAASNPKIAYGFRLLGQYAPVRKVVLKEEGENTEKIEAEELQDLSEIAALDNKEGKDLKYPKLAAMRLDIDDLGALFASGLGEKASIYKTLALSRELQLFFGAYFNKMAEKHQLYIVYSGGDDAFVIGSWINILDFAKDLNANFKTFVHNNKDIAYSAGIFTANPKYPITRLAKETGDEEELAKKQHEDKNTVQVFGHAMDWKRYVKMMEFSEKLYKQMEAKGGKIKRSVLHHLLSIVQTAKHSKGTDADFEFYRHLGRLHALVSRRGYADNKMMQEMLKEMGDFNRFQDYILPLHYVLYKTR